MEKKLKFEDLFIIEEKLMDDPLAFYIGNERYWQNVHRLSKKGLKPNLKNIKTFFELFKEKNYNLGHFLGFLNAIGLKEGEIIDIDITFLLEAYSEEEKTAKYFLEFLCSHFFISEENEMRFRSFLEPHAKIIQKTRKSCGHESSAEYEVYAELTNIDENYIRDLKTRLIEKRYVKEKFSELVEILPEEFLLENDQLFEWRDELFQRADFKLTDEIKNMISKSRVIRRHFLMSRFAISKDHKEYIKELLELELEEEDKIIEYKQYKFSWFNRFLSVKKEQDKILNALMIKFKLKPKPMTFTNSSNNKKLRTAAFKNKYFIESSYWEAI